MNNLKIKTLSNKMAIINYISPHIKYPLALKIRNLKIYPHL